MSSGVLIYVQHLMGIGHQRRGAVIARALQDRGFDVTYVSGGLPVPGLDLGEAELVQLPPARAEDTRYARLVDEHGRPVDEAWREARSRQLLDVFDRARPDVLITETFPFGRGLVRRELLALVRGAKRRRAPPLLVCSVRDIVERRDDPAKYARMASNVEAYFDLVLVHSDPGVVPFEQSFPLTRRIARWVHYTGFVVEPFGEDVRPPTSGGEVLVSAGGGVVGERLLSTAIASRCRSSLAQAPWRVLVGPDIAEDRYRALRTSAGPGVIVERNRADFPQLLRRCRVSISQGGYNTLMEVLAAGARAVVVPFADVHEREQAVRARLFAARGLIDVVEADDLDPERLARGIDRALTRSGRGREHDPPRLDGAARSAELLARRLESASGFGFDSGKGNPGNRDAGIP